VISLFTRNAAFFITDSYKSYDVGDNSQVNRQTSKRMTLNLNESVIKKAAFLVNREITWINFVSAIVL
jgi:hypothetical protein